MKLKNRFKILMITAASMLVVSSCGAGPEKMGAKKVIARPFDSADAHGEVMKNEGNEGNEDSIEKEVLTLEQIREANISFGIRSFDQINETMAVLTTVEPTTRLTDGQSINQKYGELTSQLPESNDAKAFLASHQVAISKLAVEYCDALMDNAQKRTALFPSINFTQGAAAAFGGGKGDQFAMELVNNFWGEGLNNRPDNGLLQAEIAQLAKDLMAGENTGNAASTLNVTKGVCAAVLASAPSMFL